MSDKFKFRHSEKDQIGDIMYGITHTDVIDNIIDRIESIIQDRGNSIQDGWIDVEDRLPDPTTEVLGFTLGGYGVECLLFEDDNRFYAPSERIRKPTHWQPLPSAPKQPKK